ncbi:MAG TPA: sulfatase [Phycisphaerae bacterium]|nr:sulfatase [Phycisphaerae bacterium]
MKARARKQPNIIYVFADQMRSTAIRCAGVENVITPNLDRFAGQGTRFTNAVANTPVCSPARASLLTGLHVLTHRLVNNDTPLRTDVRSIAHCLNDAGYACGYIGKWHLDCADRGVFVPPGGRRQGFDDFWAAANCNHSYFRGYYYLNDDPEPIWMNDYEPQEQTDIAIRYVQDKAGESRPFCLFLSWGPPHCPYREVPKKYLDTYPPEHIELMPTAVDARVAPVGRTAPDRPGPPSKDEQRFKRETVAGYYAHITAMDECFGRLMAALDRAGIADDTIVVFSSDHGDMLFSHNRGWKCKPWRESVGIPLIMRWPGRIPAGRVTGAPIGIVEHMATLLSLAGAQIPPAVEGEDLSAFVLGDESAAPDSAYINFPVSPAWFSCPEWRGVVTRTHTYARFRERPWVLYDDKADPFQTCNLADSPACEALRRELDAKIGYWLERTRDPFEPSRAVADKYYPGHVDMVMPYFFNEKIHRGMERLKGRRY